MNTTTQPNPSTTKQDCNMDNHVREAVAKAICRLAAKMPYASLEDATDEYLYLGYKTYGFRAIHQVTGIESGQDLLDRAIPVRAAAENAATR